MEKKKNKFLSNKVFVIFGILAILICLVAVFAPQICGDIDPHCPASILKAHPDCTVLLDTDAASLL